MTHQSNSALEEGNITDQIDPHVDVSEVNMVVGLQEKKWLGATAPSRTQS